MARRSRVSKEEDPDIVLLGFDTTLNYEKLKKACQYIRNGCIYFGMNEDLNCPMEGGTFIPDCGSMARLIEASTGRFPEFFGKPSKYTLDYIIKETGCKPEEIAIVGDRLYTDIAVADGSEVTSILVLSGESSREDVEKSRPDEFDVILMDIMMPVMNGYEAAKMIRALDRDDAKTVPIIAMTANAFTEDRLKSKESGMNEHIAKPIDAKLLVKVISELVKNKEEDS